MDVCPNAWLTEYGAEWLASVRDAGECIVENVGGCRQVWLTWMGMGVSKCG